MDGKVGAFCGDGVSSEPVTALAINMIISKMAMSNGTSFYILSVYSNAFAALLLFPTTYLFHRPYLPPSSFPVLWRIFFLASIGLEEVNFRRLSTTAKSLGTVVSISGAIIVTFYNGPAILNKPLAAGSLAQFYLSSTQNWALGGFLLACAVLATASWCILQAFILKMYPAEMIVVAFYCLFVTIHSAVVTLIFKRDATAWRINTKIGLIAILYSGINYIACRLYVTAWCIWKKGPFFVALFKPLAIVITVVIGVIFMKEALYLGSLIGSFMLVIGFYAVIWRKSEEGKIIKETESSNSQALLLDESVDEV